MKHSHQKVFAITGPESTGKSQICTQLAEHYKTVFVPEQSRVYLSNIGRKWNYSDVLEIANLQIRKEQFFRRQNHAILFCDTELIAIKVWLEFYNFKVPEHIINEIANADYAHYFLMNIDLPWQPDPLRENPNERELLFDRFVLELNYFNKPFTIISGSGSERLQNAIEALERLG